MSTDPRNAKLSVSLAFNPPTRAGRSPLLLLTPCSWACHLSTCISCPPSSRGRRVPLLARSRSPPFSREVGSVSVHTKVCRDTGLVPGWSTQTRRLCRRIGELVAKLRAAHTFLLRLLAHLGDAILPSDAAASTRESSRHWVGLEDCLGKALLDPFAPPSSAPRLFFGWRPPSSRAKGDPWYR